MSSNFLTSQDMTMITNLLGQGRGRAQDRSQNKVDQARQLVFAFENGMTKEADLRDLLDQVISFQTRYGPSRLQSQGDFKLPGGRS